MEVYVIILIIILCFLFYFRGDIKEHFESVIMTNGQPVIEDLQDKIKFSGTDVIVRTIAGKSNVNWIPTDVNSETYYPISYFVKGDWKVRMKNEDGQWHIYIYDTTYEKLSIDVSIKITFINRKNIN
jgi:hypothetical protein